MESGLSCMQSFFLPVSASFLSLNVPKLSWEPVIKAKDGVEVAGCNVSAVTRHSDDCIVFSSQWQRSMERSFDRRCIELTSLHTVLRRLRTSTLFVVKGKENLVKAENVLMVEAALTTELDGLVSNSFGPVVLTRCLTW